MRGQIALPQRGERGLPWRIGVGPQGEAGIVPIVSLAAGGPSVGIIAQSPRSGEEGRRSAGQPDGSRAYLLETAFFGPWPSRLISLDLATGAPTRRWPMPSGAMALAVSPAGKAYVADAFGDRLWRVDTRTDTLLGEVPMTGAPIALAARP
ncbi:MAG TPA: hypothetical protein VNM48_22125 [Chloroflexota bacterium]|nr:hypothetical protein [Chloroflexota bacterium]